MVLRPSLPRFGSWHCHAILVTFFPSLGQEATSVGKQVRGSSVTRAVTELQQKGASTFKWGSQPCCAQHMGGSATSEFGFVLTCSSAAAVSQEAPVLRQTSHSHTDLNISHWPLLCKESYSMATVATTDLPDEVQSLSELIGIETTTQATLYVALRDIVNSFR